MADEGNGMQQFLKLERPDATIQMTPDFTEPDELYQTLEETILKYHPSDDLSMVRKAYNIAKEAHKNQKRKSGEPYIIHPICVAIILAELQLDKETIVAGLLHDVVEDTAMTLEELEQEFSPEIALLVDGVTKLTKVKWDRGEVSKEDAKSAMQAENLRKLFMAMAQDIRVILIKLADRLHNMRTMQYQSPEKQIEKSRETIDIFSPIAARLGISKIKTELDDRALQYLYPDVYQSLETQLEDTREERQQFINTIIAEVEAAMQAEGLEVVSVKGRVKHFFSIYKKMLKQNKTLDQIYDIFAVRIIVKKKNDCYSALGVIHDMYKPLPGRFKDYISVPKPNHYQSLHTTLMGHGRLFEIQIRTEEMHQIAEYGIAAHWKYKEKGSGAVDQKEEEKKLSWLREILEWQKNSSNEEFMSMIKSDLNLFSDRVYCFTPAGDLKDLVAGSTPLDFAYSIHSAVGNRMATAKVNGKVVPFDYVLKNGDWVEIITSQNVTPKANWLSIAKSSQAKSKINQWFKAQDKETNVSKGRELVQTYCKTKSIDYLEINKPEYQKAALSKFGFQNWETLLATVGHGGLKEGQVVNRLYDEYKKKNKVPMSDQDVLDSIKKTPQNSKHHSKGGIVVHGARDVAVHFSRCCSPVPGDEIVGFITRGRGITVHRTDCVNILNLSDTERYRLIDATWDETMLGADSRFGVEINIYGENRNGMLADVTRMFDEQKVGIINCESHVTKNNVAKMTISFEIHGTDELGRIMNQLRSIKGVIDIERSIGR